MVRKIIHIDEEKCIGCGMCAEACHEGAIEMVDGKAKLMREDFCDGFGDCLPACPADAISFEEREASEYNENAVKEAKEKKKMEEMKHEHHHEGGCPGSRMRQFEHKMKKPLYRPASPFRALLSGPARSNWCRRKPRFSTARNCSSRQTVPRTPTPICTRILCAAKLRSSAARSWTRWITARN